MNLYTARELICLLAASGITPSQKMHSVQEEASARLCWYSSGALIAAFTTWSGAPQQTWDTRCFWVLLNLSSCHGNSPITLDLAQKAGFDIETLISNTATRGLFDEAVQSLEILDTYRLRG